MHPPGSITSPDEKRGECLVDVAEPGLAVGVEAADRLVAERGDELLVLAGVVELEPAQDAVRAHGAAGHCRRAAHGRLR